MNRIIQRIRDECGEYLSMAGPYPSIKRLSGDEASYHRKVKVRHKKNPTGVIRLLGKAMEHEARNIHMRCVSVNGPDIKEALSKNDASELYYIFPINGFRYLYNNRVDTFEQYQKTLKALLESKTITRESAVQLVIDSMSYTYSKFDIKLKEALKTSKEVIFYNMPYYYAVSVKKYPSYYTLTRLLQN